MSYNTPIEEGTRLKAGTTGYVYRVREVDDGTIVAVGPHGPLRVDEHGIREDIDRGKIEVL